MRCTVSINHSTCVIQFTHHTSNNYLVLQIDTERSGNAVTKHVTHPDFKAGVSLTVWFKSPFEHGALSNIHHLAADGHYNTQILKIEVMK